VGADVVRVELDLIEAHLLSVALDNDIRRVAILRDRMNVDTRIHADLTARMMHLDDLRVKLFGARSPYVNHTMFRPHQTIAG
jgi:hypothetical protein